MQYNTEGLEIWMKTYKPMANPISHTSGWNGHMFETHGPELEFVLNRIGYFVTEKQWTEPMESYDVEINEEEDELVDL